MGKEFYFCWNSSLGNFCFDLHSTETVFFFFVLIIQGAEIYELCGLLRAASNYRIDPTFLLMARTRYRVTLWPKNEQTDSRQVTTQTMKNYDDDGDQNDQNYDNEDEDEDDEAVGTICLRTLVTELAIGYIWMLHVHQHFFFPFFIYFYFLEWVKSFFFVSIFFSHYYVTILVWEFQFSIFTFKLFKLLNTSTLGTATSTGSLKKKGAHKDIPRLPGTHYG